MDAPITDYRPRGLTPQQVLEHFSAPGPTPDDCWTWSGPVNRYARTVYGVVTIDHVPWNAHRLAWVLAHGEPPPGVEVMHECDNGTCINLRHLRLGSHQQNMQDAVDRDRIAYGERQGAAVLDDGLVLQMRQWHREGMSYTDIARTVGVSINAARFAVIGTTWKHLPLEAS